MLLPELQMVTHVADDSSMFPLPIKISSQVGLGALNDENDTMGTAAIGEKQGKTVEKSGKGLGDSGMEKAY